MIRLPGVCVVCRKPVIWTGKMWSNPRLGGHRHVCPKDRAVCGAYMPYAKERCARTPLHGYEHRTAYAMANAARRWSAA